MSKKIKAKEYMNWDKTITNELTPLEALKELVYEQENIKGSDVEEHLYHIIETALKRLEELDSLYTLSKHNGKFYVVIDKVEFDQISKQLKALEIIKETRADTNIIKESKDYDDYCGLEAQKMLSLMFSAPKQKGITEEEYDLLKEVLL